MTISDVTDDFINLMEYTCLNGLPMPPVSPELPDIPFRIEQLHVERQSPEWELTYGGMPVSWPKGLEQRRLRIEFTSDWILLKYHS